jgi:chromosomal replication initiation ATPase DnaA
VYYFVLPDPSPASANEGARSPDVGSPEQLPLPFVHRPGFAEVDFLEAPSNAVALNWLARTGDWPDERLALWGAAGCGKTHLLHLWANRNGAQLVAGPTLTQVPAPGLLAIDNADAASDEAVLLHTLNAAAEARQPVLIAARLPPARWTIGLPDLASRLRAITTVEIAAAEDSLLRMLLARLLAERQLLVTPAVQDWLLLRLPRSPAILHEVVARLDRASLAARTPVTRALARLALDDLLSAEEASSDQ